VRGHNRSARTKKAGKNSLPPGFDDEQLLHAYVQQLRRKREGRSHGVCTVAGCMRERVETLKRAALVPPGGGAHFRWAKMLQGRH
jgi:hypothetical protein